MDRGDGRTLHIHLLGGLRLALGDAPLATELSPRLQSLLAWLVLHAGMPQDREYLGALLWRGSDADQARTNVRTLLHRLQRSLPEADRFLEVDRHAIAWRADAAFTCDVLEFEAAARAATGAASITRALEWYAGDLLPQAYDDWVIVERARLRDVLARLIERGIDRFERDGDLPGAVGLARRLVEHDPLGDEPVRQLMRLAAAAGDPVGVVRAYRAHARRLRRELGEEPDAATTETYERLLAEAPRVAVAPAAPAPTSAPVGPAVVDEDEGTRSAPTDLRSHGSASVPAVPTGFVGRARELHATIGLLLDPAVRLVTLTGTGGSGKTRLALEVASALLGSDRRELFPDGVRLVPLAAVRDPAAVPRSIMAALGVTETAGEAPFDTLVSHLRARQLLLVLDNFEQVADAGPLLGELLRAAAGVKLLVTSRVVLDLYGEHRVRVPPLDLPTLDPLPDRAALAQVPSVALFLQRARAADVGFALDPTNEGAVARICHRLDGLPLAIELAAAMVGELSPDVILAGLDRRLEFLSEGPRDVPARHRSLRAALDWSHDLLHPSEAALFRRLSVFVGPWTLPAAEAVPSDGETDVALVVAALVDQHLVVRSETAGEPRYGMLETVRAYALEALERSGEADAYHARHAEYHARLVEIAYPHMQGRDQVAWFERLDAIHDDLRAAVRWALEQGQPELAARLAGSLAWFWYRRGHLAEGRQWVDAVLEAAADLPPGKVLVRLTHAAGFIALEQGDNDRAGRIIRRTVALCRELGDVSGEASALNNLGVAARYSGRLREAYGWLQDALRLYRAVDEPSKLVGALGNLGELATELGRYEDALGLLEEARALAEGLGNPSLDAMLLSAIGDVERLRGRYGAARDHLDRSLDGFRAVGDRMYAATALRLLALIEIAEGHPERARPMLLEALATATELGDRWGIAAASDALARVALAAGAVDEAERYATAGLEGHRELGYAQGVARSLLTVAWVARASGDLPGAGQRCQEALALARETGDTLASAEALERLAVVRAEEGRTLDSAAALGAADGIRARIGAARAPVEALVVTVVTEQPRAMAGDAWRSAYEAARQEVQIAAEVTDATDPGFSNVRHSELKRSGTEN